MEKKISLIVDGSSENLRVDVFINNKESNISRTRIKNLILNKKLMINNKIIYNPSKKISKNDNIELIIPEPKKASLKPYKFKLDIIFEDEDLIILNKPAGIVMHPGAGNFDNTIVNALINYDKNSLSNIGDELRPGIVHRIDKNTSGLVVIAKNNETHEHLSDQFNKHTITRVYQLLIWGKVKIMAGTNPIKVLIKAVKISDVIISLSFKGAINKLVKFLLHISSKKSILKLMLDLKRIS